MIFYRNPVTFCYSIKCCIIGKMSSNVDRLDVLGGVLHRIGNFDPLNFNTSFNDRLILQKTIYLLHAFGIYIGYGFSWYLRGPYSPALTRDAFNLIERYDELPTVRFLSRVIEERFQEFLEFINGHATNEEWLEVVASIHFLSHRSPNNDQDAIWREIRNKMSRLRKNTFILYWNELASIGLIGVE